MHQQYNVSLKKNAKPLQSLILTVISVVLFLICLFYNIFLLNHKTHYTHKTLSLPVPEEPQDELSKAAKNDDWTIVTTRSGDTLASVFQRLGLSQQTLLTILQNNTHAKNLSGIKPNQQIQFLIRNKILEQLVLPLNATQVLIVSRKNSQYISKVNSREMNRHPQFLTATVQGSLYATAKRLNLPFKLVQQMTEIFNWEIDFARDLRAGDQFSILYDAFYVDDKWVSSGDILAVTYTNRGKVHQAIRHETAHGSPDYYNPQGISLKKAFSRYPLRFSHISSTFSLSRLHPVLHYRRPHKGVDLAAPIGTPIHATGDGKIEVIGRQSDYGNMIKVVHNKTYASIYGHMLKFQKGLRRGSYVKRGQVIGYVGQTGLASGPHCHYEFHVNHQPRNPTTIGLPRSSPVSAREMAAFKAQAGTLLARLKLYEEGSLAGNIVKKSKKTG
jgi:murein DD-endopeptidase MepM/ murein hydrolase activator NlpD